MFLEGWSTTTVNNNDEVFLTSSRKKGANDMKPSSAVFCGLLMVAAWPFTALAATNSSQILAIHYSRDGSNQTGEFRRSAGGWGETFPDIANPPRRWTEVNSPTGTLRLTSGGATIEIVFATRVINYSDGQSPFRRLDTITSID